MIKQRLGLVAVVVRDYDEAIDFYVDKLNFTLVEDTALSDKRWVVVQPPGSEGCGILLAKAATNEQTGRVGNQTGGRVFLFLETDDIERDYQRLLEKGVKIAREPVVQSYGTVLVFEDLYGNLIDLIQRV
jgi:catechol 2,3-dioxygenase-like lactoylglutathione lyase family enzyme